MRLVLQLILLIWVLGYLFVSCAPLLNGHLVLGAITLVGGIVLFIPWLIGVAILVFLIWASDPRRPPPGR